MPVGKKRNSRVLLDPWPRDLPLSGKITQSGIFRDLGILFSNQQKLQSLLCSGGNPGLKPPLL